MADVTYVGKTRLKIIIDNDIIKMDNATLGLDKNLWHFRDQLPCHYYLFFIDRFDICLPACARVCVCAYLCVFVFPPLDPRSNEEEMQQTFVQHFISEWVIFGSQITVYKEELSTVTRRQRQRYSSGRCHRHSSARKRRWLKKTAGYWSKKIEENANREKKKKHVRRQAIIYK